MKLQTRDVYERKTAYELALTDYKTANRFLKEGSTELIPFSLYRGFCRYFYLKWEINIYDGEMRSVLPELYAQHPSPGNDKEFWHTPGPTDKRVEALQAAINLWTNKYTK